MECKTVFSNLILILLFLLSSTLRAQNVEESDTIHIQDVKTITEKILLQNRDLTQFPTYKEYVKREHRKNWVTFSSVFTIFAGSCVGAGFCGHSIDKNGKNVGKYIGYSACVLVGAMSGLTFLTLGYLTLRNPPSKSYFRRFPAKAPSSLHIGIDRFVTPMLDRFNLNAGIGVKYTF